jgi:hypothetical protein
MFTEAIGDTLGRLEKSRVPALPGQLRPVQAMSLVRRAHEESGFFDVPISDAGLCSVQERLPRSAF